MCVRQDVRFVSESASSQLRGGVLGLNATSTSMFDRFLQAFSIFCHNFARDPSQLTRLVVIGGGVDRREGVAGQGGEGGQETITQRTNAPSVQVCRHAATRGARRDRLLQNRFHVNTESSMEWNAATTMMRRNTQEY